MNQPDTVQTSLDFTNRESLDVSYNPPMNAKNQAAKILKLLIEAKGQYVPLPRILDLRISQYSARIRELRLAGFNIENKTENVGKERRSWFRLVLNDNAASNLAAGKEKQCYQPMAPSHRF